MPLRPVLLALLAPSFVPAFASSKPKSIPNQSIDQIVAKERALGNTIRNYSPMVETYVQRMQPDNTLGLFPAKIITFWAGCSSSSCATCAICDCGGWMGLSREKRREDTDGRRGKL